MQLITDSFFSEAQEPRKKLRESKQCPTDMFNDHTAKITVSCFLFRIPKLTLSPSDKSVALSTIINVVSSSHFMSSTPVIYMS